MCGIVGAIAQRPVADILVNGLKRLEYRGYDSAGIAVIEDCGDIDCRRVKGKVVELEKALSAKQCQGQIGIAHTRWATHGEPSEINAHPHLSSGEVALVHNGIIENHDELRDYLIKESYKFSSETDTEIIAHLIHYHFGQSDSLLESMQRTVAMLKGAFALGVIHKKCPDRLIAVRQGSPLVIGQGANENFIASDPMALSALSQQVIFLGEGDIAEITIDNVKIYNQVGKRINRSSQPLEHNSDIVDKGSFRHFMQKEIFEQPQAVRATLEGRLTSKTVLANIFGVNSAEILPTIKRIQIVACGTSYHAGLIARFWLEELAGIPTLVDIASEFRYRKVIVEPGTLFIAISQSGETADTLAALRLAKQQDYLSSLAICNVAESTLVRESDLVLLTRAGVEIGVASTKAFTTQLTALLLLTTVLARTHHQLSEKEEATIVSELQQLPQLIETVLDLDDTIKTLAESFADKEHALFLGRGSQYPVALEGALKLKEISYIHAESYPAGELKHGPLALVDKNMPVVTVAPNDELFEKLKSNLHEVRARGGQLFVFADLSVKLKNSSGIIITPMPTVCKLLAPIIYTIPLQLLAYHVAVLKGTDVDQPRNLAKSVTVE